jgi:hypothetical protein
MRRRNGAYFWQLFHDSADPTHFVEAFIVLSQMLDPRFVLSLDRRR